MASKRSILTGLVPGTADYVIAHARWARSRGKRPSMPYLVKLNPRVALSTAESISASIGEREVLDDFRARIVGLLRETGEPIATLPNVAIEATLKEILRTSSSEEEIRERVRREIGPEFEEDLDLSIDMPIDKAGFEARDLIRALGGSVMANGAMVMAHMLSPTTGQLITA